MTKADSCQKLVVSKVISAIQRDLSLKADGYGKNRVSIARVGFFEVDCSEEVDDYILAKKA